MAEQGEIRDVHQILHELLDDRRKKASIAFLQASEQTKLNNLDGASALDQEAGIHLGDMGKIARMEKELLSFTGRLAQFFKDLGITPPSYITASLQEREYESISEEPVESLEYPGTPFDETPIEMFGLSCRVYNCLKKSGITMLGNIQRMTDQDLLDQHMFGYKALGELKAKLETKRLSRGDEGLIRQKQELAANLIKPRLGNAEAFYVTDNQLDLNVLNLGLEGIVRVCLIEHNIHTVEDLLAIPESDLLQYTAGVYEFDDYNITGICKSLYIRRIDPKPDTSFALPVILRSETTKDL